MSAPLSRHIALLAFSTMLLAASVSAQVASPLITAALNESNLTAISGMIHPLASPSSDQGAAPPDLTLDHVLLLLKRSPSQEAALQSLLLNLQDPTSPMFHQFVTPEQFGTQFGADDADLQTVSAWLNSHGFQVNKVSKGRTIIDFSGTAGQIQSAFHTAVHKYVVNGEAHWANSSDPLIPSALVPVIAGFRSLHNFSSNPAHYTSDMPILPIPPSNLFPPTYMSTSGGTALSPADFDVIYNVNGLSGVNGAGASIAVVARSNIKTQDVVNFRQMFGLPANPPNIIVNGVDPGVISGGEESEADLDIEWAGVAAPNATVDVVVSASTNTTDGVDLSAEYIIDNNLADVMSESFLSCESAGESSAANFYLSLSKQAAAQGITWLVAAGDTGSSCNYTANSNGVVGLAVNLIGSSPYSITVGGTQFNENGNHPKYWNSSGAATQYIPEDVWNNNCVGTVCAGSSLTPYATGGGASILFSKPTWQSGVPGNPNDFARDVPDISLTASNNYAPYVVIQEGSLMAFGGTSASTPAFAGIIALIKQRTGARLGLAAPRLYQLATTQGTVGCDASNTSVTIGSTCIFNDITVGTNAVPNEANYNTPGETYTAHPGYDLATGLGSVNVANLVNSWGQGFGTPILGTPIGMLDFGMLPVGTTSSSKTLALNNTGSGPLSIVSIVVSGVNPGDFKQTNNCGSTLAPESSCSVSVTFTPLATGSRLANLVITDNSGNVGGTMQTVTLTGTAANALLSQTITFNPVPLQVPGITAVLTANASSGLPVSFSSSTPTVCAISGNTASFLTAGTCTITASQAGNSIYSAATPVSQSINVSVSPVISNAAVGSITSTSAIITWTTDQPSTSQVNYTLGNAPGSSPLNMMLVTSHSVTVTGLSPNSSFQAIAVSANSAGAVSQSSVLIFTTLPASLVPPQVGYLAYWGVTNSGFNVSWSTDVPATTQLAYGTSNALGQLTPLQSTLTATHGVVLTGLNSGTTYYFAAQSTGANGATGYSAIYSVTTSGTSAGSPPLISNVAATNLTSTTATITWTTDQATTSLVNYGPTVSYGLATTLDSTLVTSHSVTIAGLTPGTTYNFGVVSANSGGISVTSGNATFTTSTPPSSPAPMVGYVAFWGINSSGITVSWSTDMPATTQLAYGTTNALGQVTSLQTTLAESHGVVLTGLNSGTTYYFVAQSTNANGVTGYSTTYSFTTAGLSSSPVAPVISAVSTVNVTSTSATITWTTDQPATSLVNYGTTTSYGSSSQLASSLVTSHSVTLTGLTANTAYNFDVVSQNATGQSSTSANATFATLGSTGAAPYVGYVAYWGVNNSGVTISWSTDVAATTQLSYGTTNALGQLTPLQTALTNSHGIVLTGLNSGTTYYFVAQSTTSNGITGYSTVYSFTTSGVASAPGPVISNVTSAGLSSNSATISWTTDQPSSSQVNYGTTATYGSTSVLNSTLVTAHSITLTGLLAATTYNFDVVSTNSTSNPTSSANYTFTTTAASSSGTPPILSYIAYWGLTSAGVNISYSTNVPATTQISYGTTNALGQTTPLQPTLVSSHGVSLTGLTSGTTYYFVAQSTDVNGNTGFSTMQSFTTNGTALPVISNITVTTTTDNTAVISWTTSTATNNYVQYGTTTAYNRYSAQTTLITTPQCILPYVPSGLNHYQLISTDVYGNQGVTADATFIEP